MKLYEYEVTIQDNAGDRTTETIERVASYTIHQTWAQFYGEDGDAVAEFATHAMISVIRGSECDPDPKADSVG